MPIHAQAGKRGRGREDQLRSAWHAMPMPMPMPSFKYEPRPMAQHFASAALFVADVKCAPCRNRHGASVQGATRAGSAPAVLVHCVHGTSRSATIAAALLIQCGAAATAGEALASWAAHRRGLCSLCGRVCTGPQLLLQGLGHHLPTRVRDSTAS